MWPKEKLELKQNAAERVIGMISLAAARTQRRMDLLKPIKRWTYGRKIQVCAGLCANFVSVSDVILAHGLGHDEIDRWMEAYKKWDFEALKIGYAKKRKAT